VAVFEREDTMKSIALAEMHLGPQSRPRGRIRASLALAEKIPPGERPAAQHS
jgi:hypothetical protein